MTLFQIPSVVTGVQTSIGMVADILNDVFQGQPGLGSSGDDLIGWQDETMATSVSQLKSKGVFDAQIVGPVNTAATGLI